MIRVDTSRISPPGTLTLVVGVTWCAGVLGAMEWQVPGGVGCGWGVDRAALGGVDVGRGSNCVAFGGAGGGCGFGRVAFGAVGGGLDRVVLVGGGIRVVAVRWRWLMAAVAGGAWISTACLAGGTLTLSFAGVDPIWRAGGVTGLHGLVGRRMVGSAVSSRRLAARSRTLARILSGVNGAAGGAGGGGGRQHCSNIASKRSSSSMSFAI